MAKGQNLIDITGQKFHRLTCVGFSHTSQPEPHKNKGGRSYWLWRCDCGKEVIARKDQIIYSYSHQKSCGCLMREVSSKQITAINKSDWKREQMSGDNHHMRKPGTWRAKHDKKTGRFINVK